MMPPSRQYRRTESSRREDWARSITAGSEGKTASTTTLIEAPPSADLIYQRTDLVANELYVLGFGAGVAPARLNAGNVSHQPTVSADGSRLAFFVSMTGPTGEVVEDIFAVDRIGTNMKRLTTAPGVDNAPAWSPDNGFDLSPSWSPDGRRIVFQRGGIAIVTVETGEVTYLGLPGRATQPSWSPDGRHIAFAWLPSEPGSGV